MLVSHRDGCRLNKPGQTYRDVDGQVRTDGVGVRQQSPGLLSGSSGNVGGSPDIHTAPGRWPSLHAVWASHPDKVREFGF